jgi:DNA-binding transcriptional MerR regulator
MKIGQAAAEAEVSVDTVRFYERRGVLPTPQRRPSGYREYQASTVEWIRMAPTLQQMGFTLEEIIDALHAHDTAAPILRRPGSASRLSRCAVDLRPSLDPDPHRRGGFVCTEPGNEAKPVTTVPAT